jgi:cytochrome c biogenesis protein CcdA
VLRVALFTAGVFAVNLGAGLLLTAGPGRLLLRAVPHPERTLRSALELAAGVVVLAAGLSLWLARSRLARRALPAGGGNLGGAALAGVSIAAVELPTAAPYLAVVVAVAASGANNGQALVVLGIYCAAFVAPLLAIVALLLVAGERADPMLLTARARLQRRWPVVLAALLVLVGLGLIVAGAAGLLGR